MVMRVVASLAFGSAVLGSWAVGMLILIAAALRVAA